MLSRGTIAGRARLEAAVYADQFPSSLPGDLGQAHVAEESEGRSAPPRAARILASCPVYPTAPLRELLTYQSCSHPLPQCATACSSCGAVNLSSPEPNKLNFTPKGAWAVFCKQRLHKSCLSPSRLTLFSLPPHLLLAKLLNSFSIYCGSLKPKAGALGRMQNSSALWPLPSGGAGNCLLPLLCNPALITLLNPWRKQLQKKIFVLWQAHVCTFPALEVLN